MTNIKDTIKEAQIDTELMAVNAAKSRKSLEAMERLIRSRSRRQIAYMERERGIIEWQG